MSWGSTTGAGGYNFAQQGGPGQRMSRVMENIYCRKAHTNMVWTARVEILSQSLLGVEQVLQK